MMSKYSVTYFLRYGGNQENKKYNYTELHMQPKLWKTNVASFP